MANRTQRGCHPPRTTALTQPVSGRDSADIAFTPYSKARLPVISPNVLKCVLETEASISNPRSL